MFGLGRRTDALLSILRAENSDLRQTLREERAAWVAERQGLLDRIVALASPAVLRELRRDAAVQPTGTPSPQRAVPEWRPNFPGVEDAYPDPPPKEKGDRILDQIVSDLKAESNGRQ
jgi:hypothetical protein